MLHNGRKLAGDQRENRESTVHSKVLTSPPLYVIMIHCQRGYGSTLDIMGMRGTSPHAKERVGDTSRRLYHQDACKANKWEICYSLYIVNTTGWLPLEKSYCLKQNGGYAQQ
jgi:hypothetical protein